MYRECRRWVSSVGCPLVAGVRDGDVLSWQVTAVVPVATTRGTRRDLGLHGRLVRWKLAAVVGLRWWRLLEGHDGCVGRGESRMFKLTRVAGRLGRGIVGPNTFA